MADENILDPFVEDTQDEPIENSSWAVGELSWNDDWRTLYNTHTGTLVVALPVTTWNGYPVLNNSYYYKLSTESSYTYIGSGQSQSFVIPSSALINNAGKSIMGRLVVTNPENQTKELTTSYRPIVHNNPPTQPTSISVPSSATVNASFTISWGASTDQDGHSIDYYVERRASGGSWASVTSTTSTSVSTSVPTTGTYHHRVRATDYNNAYSSWKESTATIINPLNRPPSTPASITMPSTIRLGIAFTVSWTASTDPDGHAITYYLDRQTNGGSWTNIATTSALQYAQTLSTTSGITSVAYRVRAKDSQGLYSDYRTSETRQISANRPPTQPPSITIPETILHNQQVPISWGASTDPDGDAITYELYRYHLVGSTATNTRIYSGSNRAYTDTALPANATRVRYDVQAKDVLGATSALRQSPIVDLIRNVPPSISGQDMDLGTFGDSVSHMYTVTDGDNDNVEVVEKLNGTTIRTYKPPLGVKQQLLIDGNDFTLLPNGRHTITITATDDDGASYTRTLTFTKHAVSLSATAANAVPATKRPHRINVVLTGAFPSGSWRKVFVTNNGLDDAPVWEDATQAAMSKMAHVFQNTSKKHKEWAVNVKVIVHRGESLETDKCNLQGICGHWE